MILFLAVVGPVIVRPKQPLFLVLGHFYSLVPQSLVCLLLIEYVLAFKKSKTFIEVRQSVGKVYLQLLVYNLCACLSYFAVELITSYLLGARFSSQEELVITAIFIFTKFLVLFLSSVMYAYGFVAQKSWPLFLVGALIPLLYHYLLEATIISVKLFPYYSK